MNALPSVDDASEQSPVPAADGPDQADKLPRLVWSLRRHGRTVAQSAPNATDPEATLAALRATPARVGDTHIVSSLDWSDPLPRDTWSKHLDRENQGLIALAFLTEDETRVITPERSIAWNEPPHQALQHFLERGIGTRSFDLRTARSTTTLVQTGHPTIESELHRGTTPVPLAPEPGEDRALTIATGIASWMLRNLTPNGELPYLWLTSEEAPDRQADNAIRRFLGAIGLGRLGVCQDDHRLTAAYRLHLAHLLDRYLEPLGE